MSNYPIIILAFLAYRVCTSYLFCIDIYNTSNVLHGLIKRFIQVILHKRLSCDDAERHSNKIRELKQIIFDLFDTQFKQIIMASIAIHENFMFAILCFLLVELVVLPEIWEIPDTDTTTLTQLYFVFVLEIVLQMCLLMYVVSELFVGLREAERIIDRLRVVE